MQKILDCRRKWFIRLTSLVWIIGYFGSHRFTEACECGLSPEKRIYNGYGVKAGDYSWMALLLTVNGDEVTICGASLISSQYLVTAGHCCPNSASNSFVTFGTSGFETAFYKSTRHAVEKFMRKSSGIRGKDIGIVKLKRGVNNQPICLPSKTATYANVKATILGFGEVKSGDTSRTLLGGHVKVPSNDQCNKAQPQRVLNGEICGGNYGGGPAICNGDSGGPLMYYNPKSKRWEIIGIVSGSYDCSSTTTYGIFTRVSSQISWIQSNTKNAGCQK